MTPKEHYKEEQSERRLGKRMVRATRATNYVRDGKTYSSSGREDLMFSPAGDTKAQARVRASSAKLRALKAAQRANTGGRGHQYKAFKDALSK
jgi:hypothetical protein